MFQDDINLMDGEHMECILGHQRRQFEVKPGSVDLVGQQKPSGQINYVLPGTELFYISQRKKNSHMLNSVFWNTLENTLKCLLTLNFPNVGLVKESYLIFYFKQIIVRKILAKMETKESVYMCIHP